MGIGYPLYAIGMIMIQALNGSGDALLPAVLNLICCCLLQIPLALFLAEVAGFGPNGVFLSIVISESLLTVLGVMVFRRGTWKARIARLDSTERSLTCTNFPTSPTLRRFSALSS